MTSGHILLAMNRYGHPNITPIFSWKILLFENINEKSFYNNPTLKTYMENPMQYVNNFSQKRDKV